MPLLTITIGAQPSAIGERFEVSEEVARQDLLALVEHLDREGLIQPERR